MTKKLFVGNLPDGCTKEELGDLLGKFGSVAECDVIANKNYGFVHMGSETEAQEAVTQLDSYLFMGNIIKVQFSTTEVHKTPGIGSKGECFKCGSKGHLSRDCDSGGGRGRSGRGGRGRGFQGGRGGARDGYRDGFRDRPPFRRDGGRFREDFGGDIYRDERSAAFMRRGIPRDFDRYLDDPYSRRMAFSAREYELLYRSRSRSPIRGYEPDYRRPLYSSASRNIYDRIYGTRAGSFYDMPPRSRVPGPSRSGLTRY